jgi:hypothetical protein
VNGTPDDVGGNPAVDRWPLAERVELARSAWSGMSGPRSVACVWKAGSRRHQRPYIDLELEHEGVRLPIHFAIGLHTLDAMIAGLCDARRMARERGFATSPTAERGDAMGMPRRPQRGS